MTIAALGSCIDTEYQYTASWSLVRVVRHGSGLVLLVLHTLDAYDVELDTVPNDLARDVVSNGAHEAFDRDSAELPDVPASDADGMVMVLDARETVPRRAVEKVQPADDAGVQEQLDRAKDRCATDEGQLLADLLGGEAFLLLREQTHDRAPRRSRAVTAVLEDGHDVRTRR